jgi:hypothetical protein
LWNSKEDFIFFLGGDAQSESNGRSPHHKAWSMPVYVLALSYSSGRHASVWILLGVCYLSVCFWYVLFWPVGQYSGLWQW